MENVELYHKGHKITIIENHNWFCSYVDGIENAKQYDTSYGIGCEVTFTKDNEVGFDTNHMYNEDMTQAGKFYDALRQALCFINELKKEY